MSGGFSGPGGFFENFLLRQGEKEREENIMN